MLQITSGLPIYGRLFKFVEDQQKERMDIKQNTFEGKLVKVVTEILNEARNNVLGISFQTIWNRLKDELDGRIDDKKPNVMDTSEFFQVTKNKVGYRLKEILSGKTRVVREKDANGEWVSAKAYDFELDKIEKVARKYGYELVTKLPSLPSSEGTQVSKDGQQASKGMEKTVKTEANGRRNISSEPQELGKLSNSVTATEDTEVKTENQKKETGTRDIEANPLVVKGSEAKFVNFRRLAPNEPHPCDGEGHGCPCPVEAKYLMSEGNYYCETHFLRAKSDCESNGYAVVEIRQQADEEASS
jgi:hypothetical protein